MKLLAVVLVLALFVALVALIAWGIRRQLAERARWELDERSERGRVVVRAVRPGGGEPLVVGAVPFDDPEFELKIEELRAEGRSRVIALNSGLPPGRR